MRHDLFLHLKTEETKEKLSQIEYDPQRDTPTTDEFGPITKDTLVLPKDVQVEIISQVDHIKKLDALLSEPYIGVDAEWKPSFGRFQKSKVSLFQMSGRSTVFLIDFFQLKESVELDKKLT